jgi:hypothetical protein
VTLLERYTSMRAKGWFSVPMRHRLACLDEQIHGNISRLSHGKFRRGEQWSKCYLCLKPFARYFLKFPDQRIMLCADHSAENLLWKADRSDIAKSRIEAGLSVSSS